MQSTTNRQLPVKLLALASLCVIAFGFIRPLGLDTYEIYLNKQLIMKNHIKQPLSLRKLPLDKTNANDELRIYYRHCMTPNVGSDRSITIRDDRGNILKKWTFEDATGNDYYMVIPVRELRRVQKDHSSQDLSMHYAAKELAKEETLAFLHFK